MEVIPAAPRGRLRRVETSLEVASSAPRGRLKRAETGGNGLGGGFRRPLGQVEMG